MKRLLLLSLIPMLFCNAGANEIDGEINVSWMKPYEIFMPGFNVTFRPEMLELGRFSFGAGLGMHVSSRYNYDNSPNWIEFVPSDTSAITDTTDWFYFDEEYVELVNYELNTETRFRIFGTEDDHWKGYLSLHAGYILHSAQRTLKQTVAEQLKEEFYNDSLYSSSILYSEANTFTFKTEFESSFYFAPGVVLGVGNFIVGYRHWFHLSDRALVKGEPAESYFTFRVGYRFIW